MKTVAVFGGSGFIGRHLAVALAAHGGYRVRLPVRNRERVKRDLILLPNTDVFTYDSTSASAVGRALAHADIVVNLVGILNEDSDNLFERVHGEFVRLLAEGCIAHHVPRFIQMSALGAAAGAPSAYLRSKSKAEKILTSNTGLEHTILRASVVCGEGDRFINLFAPLIRRLPIIFLPCGYSQMQPIAVEDVVQVIIRVLESERHANQTLHLGGPHAYTLAEIVETLAAAMACKRRVIPLGHSLSYTAAAVLEKLPFVQLITRDNCLSATTPSTVSKARNDAMKIRPQLLSLANMLDALQTKGNALGAFRYAAGR